MIRKALSGQTDIPACFCVQTVAGDRNRCAGKGIRDFHLWENKMRKHPRHNECPVIMVIGHTRLFNECFFSASPLMPIVNVMLLVWLQCRAPSSACPLDTEVLHWSRHLNVIWWSAQHRGVDAARSQHDSSVEGGGFVLSFIKAPSTSKRRQNLSGLWRMDAVFMQFPVMKKSCWCWKAAWIFSFCFFFGIC